MRIEKKLGIWMDHSTAHVMEFSIDTIETEKVESEFTHQEKEHSLSKSENLMHNKEQQKQGAFYKHLADIIKNYDDVILFGPTNAKVELLNILNADHHFENIKIRVEQADKMTENQEHAFVKEYFAKHNLIIN